MALRILLADQHGIVRRGLRGLLQVAFKHASFAETETSQATIAALQREKWHLVILEPSLPDSDGLATLPHCAGTPLLVFTAFAEEQMGVAAIVAGARAYLSKTATDAEIMTAVTALLAGREYCSPRLRELLAAHVLRGSRPAGLGTLSVRERMVFREFERGRTVKEIAAHLGLVASTVSTYRIRILRKLGLRTTNELLRYNAERRLHQYVP